MVTGNSIKFALKNFVVCVCVSVLTELIATKTIVSVDSLKLSMNRMVVQTGLTHDGVAVEPEQDGRSNSPLSAQLAWLNDQQRKVQRYNTGILPVARSPTLTPPSSEPASPPTTPPMQGQRRLLDSPPTINLTARYTSRTPSPMHHSPPRLLSVDQMKTRGWPSFNGEKPDEQGTELSLLDSPRPPPIKPPTRHVKRSPSPGMEPSPSKRRLTEVQVRWLSFNSPEAYVDGTEVSFNQSPPHLLEDRVLYHQSS